MDRIQIQIGMDNQKHPTFRKQFTQGLFIGVFISVFSAFIGIFLSRNRFFVAGHDLMIASGVFVIGTLLYLSIKFFNVRCPKCGKKTQTHTDARKTHWLASCNNCKTSWDLEIGYQTKHI